MLIVFPSSLDSPYLPAAKFLKESLACEDLHIDFTTVDLHALMAGQGSTAFAKTARRSGELGIYRGGTLRPREYAEMHAALADRGIQLLTTPEQFARTQLFDYFYPLIADASLPAVTTSSLDPAFVRQLAFHKLGLPPYFIKDYVKSTKEIWPLGCVIEAPGSVAQFTKAIHELRDFRGDRFESGLVIRPLVQLRSLGVDPFGDAVWEEYRMIYLQGKLVFANAYGYTAGSFTDFARFDPLATNIDSPFFMADCVVTTSGECYLLETGDGGCCGLPPALTCREFYAALRDRFS